MAGKNDVDRIGEQLYSKACKAASKKVASQLSKAPEKALVLQSLAESSALSGHTSEAAGDKPWPATYTYLDRYNIQQQLKNITQWYPHAEWGKARVVDPKVISKAFFRTTGLSAKHGWPQGAAHVKNVIGPLLTEWVQRRGPPPPQGGDLDQSHLVDSRSHTIDWTTKGFFTLSEAEAGVHKGVVLCSSGAQCNLPTFINAEEGKWCVDKNYDIHEAIITNGVIEVKISTFFPDAVKAYTDVEWKMFVAEVAPNIVEQNGMVKDNVSAILAGHDTTPQKREFQFRRTTPEKMEMSPGTHRQFEQFQAFQKRARFIDSVPESPTGASPSSPIATNVRAGLFTAPPASTTPPMRAGQEEKVEDGAAEDAAAEDAAADGATAEDAAVAPESGDESIDEPPGAP